MMRLKNISVGLELSHVDSYVLTYLKRVTNYLKPEKITFFNVYHEDVPNDVVKKFPEIRNVIDDHYVREMVEETANVKLFGCEIDYIAIQDKVLEGIIKSANKSDTELLVLGRKNDRDDRNIHFKQIVRKSTSNVLVIPENEVGDLTKILVPVDFSEYGKFSVLQAIEIAKSADAEVIVQHIYEVPVGYSKSGKTFLEFAKIMESNAKESSDAFLKEINFKGVKHDVVFSLNEEGSVSKTIESSIDTLHADFLVLGSKGKNKFSALMLGSTAESMLTKRALKTPILLTRMNKDSMSIWETIDLF